MSEGGLAFGTNVSILLKRASERDMSLASWDSLGEMFSAMRAVSRWNWHLASCRKSPEEPLATPPASSGASEVLRKVGGSRVGFNRIDFVTLLVTARSIAPLAPQVLSYQRGKHHMGLWEFTKSLYRFL